MDSRVWVLCLATIGVAIVVSGGWHLSTNPATASWLHTLIDLVLFGVAGTGYLYGAYWYRDRPFDTEHYPTIAIWIVGFGRLFASLSIISVYIGSNVVRPLEFREVLHVTGSVGLFAGLVIGTMHSRSIQHAETAARVEAEAEALAAEHERLEALNGLLRHYILNGVAIISGYANQLRGDVPSEAEPSLDVIDERAELIATLVEHIGSLQRQGQPLEPRRLDPVIESAIAEMDRRHDLAIEADVCPHTVLLDEGFEDALRLLCEAVCATTEDEGTLTITCHDHDTDGIVTLTVTATPASLPDSLKESLFEPISSGVALELYIVDQLIDKAGEIQLQDTPEETLEFDIALTSAS